MIIFRAYVDLWRGVKYAYVEVRLFNTAHEMRDDIDACEFGPHKNCHGQCSGLTHYNKAGRLTGKFAAMWLNKEHLRENASEIIAHECVHAAMRHINNRRVDLSNMAGEEALCYTAGSLTAQINGRLHKLGIFD